MNTMVVIPFLCLLAMIRSSIAQENYVMPQNETIWLGESITLATKKIPDISRPVIWESGDLKYECDSTCAETSYYKVAETDGVSTIWIKEVSSTYAKWKFNDDNFHFGTIDMKINVKPKIDIKNKTDCEYTVMAECSLPETSIECFVGENSVTFTSNTTKTCADGKTYTTTATITHEVGSGTLKCHFTMGTLFKKTLTREVKCPVKPKIDIKKKTDCEYTVIAECSLPETSIECFVGENPVTFTSNTTNTCADGKTYTTTATLKLHISGTLICHFTMGKLFKETLTREVKCPDNGNIPGIVIPVVLIIIAIIAVIVYGQHKKWPWCKKRPKQELNIDPGTKEPLSG